jgi:hypothetical protein
MTYVEDAIHAALVAAGFATARFKYRFWSESRADQILICPGGGSGEIATGGDILAPRVQVLVRSANDTGSAVETARDEIWAVIDALHLSESISNVFGCVWDMQDPKSWLDDKKRTVFAAEFKVYTVKT